MGLQYIHRNPGEVRYTTSSQTVGMKADPWDSSPDTLEGPPSRVIYMLEKDANIENYLRGMVWTLDLVEAARKVVFNVGLVTTTEDLSNLEEMEVLENSEGHHKVVSGKNSIELVNHKLEFAFSKSREKCHVYTWGRPDGDMLALHAIARKDGAESKRLEGLGVVMNDE